MPTKPDPWVCLQIVAVLGGFFVAAALMRRPLLLATLAVPVGGLAALGAVEVARAALAAQHSRAPVESQSAPPVAALETIQIINLGDEAASKAGGAS